MRATGGFIRRLWRGGNPNGIRNDKHILFILHIDEKMMNVQIFDHARKRMASRGISQEDVIAAVEKGELEFRIYKDR